MNGTTRGNRVHIGIFGRTNSGKSSLINALTNQKISIVSDVEGTTTDPVYKSMEFHPAGPVVFIDTAGFNDDTELGSARENRTLDVIDETDVAILLFDEEKDLSMEAKWAEKLKAKNIPTIYVISKGDEKDRTSLEKSIKTRFGAIPIVVNGSDDRDALKEIRLKIGDAVTEDIKRESILRDLISRESVVVLVMPQDIQAPKGRLILPQVQTIRELLDRKCIAVSTTLDNAEKTLTLVSDVAELIITDSQCFKTVKDIRDKITPRIKLTSFSVLFSAFKGDIREFIRGAKAIDSLTENSKILIAEACTHAPLEEDIGRVKIPNMLKKRFGSGLKIDVVSGNDFTENLEEYDLIIHCGACMFNRKYMMSRVDKAVEKEVPITNYGVTIAQLLDILDDIVY